MINTTTYAVKRIRPVNFIRAFVRQNVNTAASLYQNGLSTMF